MTFDPSDTGLEDWKLRRSLWQLNPDVDFLNHGSFGACPRVVIDAQRRWYAMLEADPIEFLAPERQLEPKLDAVRHCIANLIHAPAENVAFVRNATDGVNAVLRSFPLRTGDEILVTSHGYNACINAARYAAEHSSASVRVADVPFPIESPSQVIEAIVECITSRTRVLLVDHVTSFSGLIFPLKEIISEAKRRGVRVLVDGAHAPGMIDVDLNALKPDYYTANHHKWLCGPKVSGFLYVDPQWQSEVRPTVISHAANRPRKGRSRFLAEFDWPGTYDPAPLLAMLDAIDFLSQLHGGGMEDYRAFNHSLALQAGDELRSSLALIAPAPSSMLGSMVTLPVPQSAPDRVGSAEEIHRRLFEQYRIEVPVFAPPDSARIDKRIYFRISCQAYNHLSQYRRLARAFREMMA